MNYLKFGESKKFIVFLHGWGADLNSFLFAKDYFQDYSKVFVDFAGFGKTPQPTKPYFVSNYVEELEKLLINFDIEELVLVGHSFGGRVAVKFACLNQFNYKIFKLCLVDAAGIRPKLSWMKKWKIFKFKQLKKRADKNDKIKRKLSNFGSNDYKKLTDVMKKTFVNIVNEDLSIFAEKIVCHTAIIWGDKDKETPFKMAKKLHKLICYSKIFVINGAGHFSFLDDMQEFLIILDTFIKN